MPTPPKPTASKLREYLAKFEKLEKYRLQEDSLNLLFQKLCPENKEIEHVLLKVSALNDFYSTNIFGTYAVAKHILKVNVDLRLKDGDYSLVDEIARVRIKGKTRNFHSFASKYCSHHKPKIYPICDSFVLKMLMYYKTKYRFDHFIRTDLNDYNRFVETIKKFKECYGLDEFSLRDVDIFLWQVGKKYFPKNYKSTRRLVTISTGRGSRTRKARLEPHNP